MTIEELWSALCERYPEFADEQYIVRQRARGLKQLLEQAWNEGHEKGWANGKAMEKMRQDAEAKKDPIAEFFGFGK